MSQSQRGLFVNVTAATMLILLLAFNMALVPVVAGEAPVKKQDVEHEVISRLLRGEGVEELVTQLTPRTRNAARYQTQSTAENTARSLASLRTQLESISRKGQLEIDDVVALQASFEQFKSYHLLLAENFNATRASLKKNGADSVYFQRLDDAEKLYRTAVEKLLTLDEPLQQLKVTTNNVSQLPDKDYQERLLGTIRSALEAINSHDKHPSAPILRAATLPYRQAQLASRAPVLTPTIVPSYRNTSDTDVQPDLVDLADSADAPLSEAILQQAKELDYDYIRIYEYVRNTIKTEWYAGGMKGALGTLRQGSGNDVDQASLLIALFRASGLASRYVHGVIELPIEDVMNSLGLQDAMQATTALTRAGVAFKPIVRGGRVAVVQVEHTWVTAYVPYTNYRGSVVDISGKTWLPLAPSLKKYNWNPSTAALRKAGVNTDEVINAYLSASHSEDLLVGIRNTVNDYIYANTPDLSYEQQLGGREIAGLDIGLLPTSLPVDVVAVTGESATLADSYRQRLRFVARQGSGAADPIILDVTLPLAEVTSRRVTLSYMPATVADQRLVNQYGGLDLVPAYLINLRPQIKLDGKQRAVAKDSLAAGAEHRFELYVIGPSGSQRIDQTFVAGSYHAMGIVSQQLSAGANTLEEQVDSANADPADTEFPAARLLSWRALNYIDEWNRAEEELAGLLNIAVVRPLPAVTIASNASSVESVMGQPMRLQWRGVTLDAALRIAEPIPMGSDSAAARDWMRLSALQGSSLEHLLFERDFLVNSVSADKGLGLAREAGIPVISITSANLSVVLPELNHPSNVLADVENWVRLGMNAEIPRDAIKYKAWQGSVWRIEDPQTGAAGYYIAGALAGGATSDDPANWTLQDLADLLQSPNSTPPNPDPLAAAEIIKINVTDGQRGEVGSLLSAPLAVMVRDKNGTPVKGAEVTFYASAGGGYFDGDAATEGVQEVEGPISVLTNELGVAQADFVLGKSTSDYPIYMLRNADDEYVTRAGQNLIDVSVNTYNGLITTDSFRAIGYPKAVASIQRTNPPVDVVIPGTWADTIIVSTVDEYGNPVSNVPVAFTSGGSVAVKCSSDTQPPFADAVVFDATVDSGECPANPILGDCGTSSRSAKSTVYGVSTGVIAGQGISSFAIQAAAEGVESVSWQYTLASVCNDTLQARAISESIINEQGRVINAAKPGDTFKRPIEVTLFVGSQKEGWVRADADSASFQVENGGSSVGTLALGNGGYSTNIITGLTPGANKVYFTAVNPGGHKNSDGSDWVFRTLVNGVYGVEPTVTKTESPGQDPGIVYLNDAGQSAYPVAVHFTVAPAEYMSETSEVDFLREGVWEDYAIVMQRTGDGSVPLPRGTVYNIDESYEAQLVLNRGSAAEVKSDRFKLKLRQNIFKNISPYIRVSQDVDFVNQRACPIGKKFFFTLTQPAQVTLAVKETKSNIDKTLVNNVSYPKGENAIDIDPDDLPPGEYTFTLSGVSAIDGHVDVVTGVALSEFTGTSSLPVGHTLVKGVSVKSGSLSMGAEDFTLPGRGVPLSFSRNYSSSASMVPGVLGIGWSHNYESKLILTPCGEVIVSGAGTGMRFVSDGNDGYVPLKGYHGTLIPNAQDDSFDFYSKDGTRYHFRMIGTKPERYLEYIADTNGNVTKLAYDPTSLDEPRVISVQDPAGRTITFTYEQKSFTIPGATVQPLRSVITKVTAPGGIEMAFTYNEFGNLITAARENGSRVEQYEYTTSDTWAKDRKLNAYTNPNGKTTHYSYNEGYLTVPNGGGFVITQPYSLVEQVTEPEGGNTSFEYDLANYLQTKVTDPRGNVTTYGMNAYGSVLSITDPAGTTTMTWADDDVVMTNKTDGRGVKTDYTYDKDGNLLIETTGSYTTEYSYKPYDFPPIKNRVETIKDRNGNLTTNEYDGHGNLTKVIDAEGGKVEHSYDGNGDRRYTRDANGNFTHYHHDGYGNVDWIVDPLGGKTVMEYDIRSRLLSTIDPLDRATSYSYDTLGRLVEQHDPAGGNQTFSYDAVGNKLSETDAEKHTTTWEYDGENRPITITNAKGDKKSFEYDAAGNKTAETDWRNNQTTYEYDGANRLITRSEPLGRITRFSYDKVGNVLSETDPLEHTTYYDYDDLNRRIRITDPLSHDTLIGYDGINKTSETDALKRVTSYSYDKNNRLITQSEPLGRVTHFEYDDNGNRTAVTDPNGNRRTLTYDALNRVTKKSDALGHDTNISYDAVGNVLTEINARLAQTHHEYDALNRRIKTIDPLGKESLFSYDRVGNLIGETWANGNQVTHRYDELNRLVATTDSLGAVAAYEYDANGNRTLEQDARGNSATHSYDALNRLTQSVLPQSRTLDFAYDLAGNKTRETDANRKETLFAYNELNRLVSVTDPFSHSVGYSYDEVGNRLTETDKRHHTTTTAYDALNRPSVITDPLGQTISFTYDANGNKLTETDKRGTKTTYTYDRENRLLTTEKGGVTLVRYEYDEVGNKEFERDANGNTNAYVYDLRNLMTRESLPLAAITDYKYNAMGDVVEVRDPEARTTTSSYDLRRRLLSETNGAGESTSYSYDGNGNRLSRKRPQGNSWSYEYDDADRLSAITDPLSGVTRYSYDGNGNRLTQTDANDNTTRYEYDALNRQTAMVYADETRAEFRYDENGNRTGLTDPKRQQFSYVYDELNRETLRSYPAPVPATGDDIQSIATSYDANSNVTAVTELYSGASGTRVTSKSYDIYDRLLSVTDAFGKTLKYQYDANGNRTRLTDPDNQVTQYSFDALNRLVGVLNGGGATSYGYDRSGLKTKVTYPNGTLALTSYDRAGRVLTIDNKQGSATVSSYLYSYDRNGNRTQQLESNGGAAETTRYTFDDNDRLTGVVYPGLTTRYSYDAAYNRLTERSVDNVSSDALVDKSYRYNSRNQLTAISDNLDAAQSVSYSFDANGNQTLKSKNGSITTFIYDVRDQLVSVQENATTLGLFRYDYRGMRVGREAGGESLRYTYDGNSVLLQSDAQGQTVAKYDYGPDQLLSMLHAGEGRQFYLFDALGSVSNLTNTSGTVQARYQYDAFGNMRAEAGSSFNRFTFTGHEKDSETGLYYFKARFYDPDTGRFLNQDAYLGDVGTPPSLHRYLYAYGNPVVYVDLDGYESVSTMIDNAAEGCGAWGCAGWALLKAAYTVSTLGFASVHDPVRDRYDNGQISGSEYALEGIGGGMAVVGINLATARIGGTAVAAATSLGGRAAVASGVGAASAALGDATTQGVHIAAGVQSEYDVDRTVSAMEFGAVLGGGSTVVTEGAIAAKQAISSRLGQQGSSRLVTEGASGETQGIGQNTQRPSSRTASTVQSPAEVQGPTATTISQESHFGWDSVGAARVKGSVVEMERTGGNGSFRQYVEAERGILGRGEGGVPNSKNIAGDFSADAPYVHRYDPAHPGRPDPHYSLDSTTFEKPVGYNAQGFPRDAGAFWKQWAELNPESLSSSNKYLIENYGRLKVSPRIDETWIKSFPEHGNYLKDILVHHHVSQGKYTIPVPGKTHKGPGGPWHKK